MARIRHLPVLPELAPLPHVSASQAWRLFSCPLQVLLDADPSLKELRPHAAAALLGTAAHLALAALDRAADQRGDGDERGTRDLARDIFDEALSEVCSRRDRDIDARGGELPGEAAEQPADLPYYALTRARVGRLAVERYGASWVGGAPRIATRSATRPDGAQTAARSAPTSGSEIPLRSRDGRLRGSADTIRQAEGGVEIEELKSGEATAEHLAAWTFQLMLYAHLFHEQTGSPPRTLRIVSLHGATHERRYEARDASDAARRASDALSDLNAAICRGATPVDLARPSAETCRHCTHRPWCDAYWTARPCGDADVEGIVRSADGWCTTIVDRGVAIDVDFRSFATVPSVGERLRICDTRPQGNRKAVARTSLVWSVPA